MRTLGQYWKSRHLTVSEIVLRCIAFVFFVAVAASYVYLIFWCFYSGMRSAGDFWFFALKNQ